MLSIQTELEKLYLMKQDLQAAAHRCENMGSMESLDKTDTSGESPLTQLAEVVNRNLQDSISKVRRQPLMVTR